MHGARVPTEAHLLAETGRVAGAVFSDAPPHMPGVPTSCPPSMRNREPVTNPDASEAR